MRVLPILSGSCAHRPAAIAAAVCVTIGEGAVAPSEAMSHNERERRPPLPIRASGRPSTPPEALFVARQPIFDRERKVVGYELLFRSGAANVFPAGVDPDKASKDIIGRTLSVFGIGALTGEGGVAYLNVTRRTMVDGLYAALPADRVVLELLETLRPDPETLEACRAARAAGYTIALDDFTGQDELDAFLNEIDVLKVDFRGADDQRRSAIAQRCSALPIKLLAEKIETDEDFQLARQLGFALFQGYFFCRPEMIARQDVPVSKVTYLNFLLELNRPEIDFGAMERLIKSDVALSLKLLRYLKAAAFGWRKEITSIRHALSLLGERAFRRWASVLVISVLADDRSTELLTTCLLRARFLELLAPKAGFGGRELELFLVGLFSLIEPLVGRPLAELLSDVQLPAALADVLLPSGKPSRMRDALALVTAYERAGWEEVDALLASLNISESKRQLPKFYEEALSWALTTARSAA